MKISEIKKDVKFIDFENFFNVYEDSNHFQNPYFFNLNSTVYFDGVHYSSYSLKHNMFWTTISYDIYGTTRLWWLLMKINNVKADDIFNCVKAGQTVKYIDKETVKTILSEIFEI